MGAKDLVLRPVGSRTANAVIRRLHYSGKVVPNSQLHLGVFYEGRIEGCLSFGPSLDKRKIIVLVEGTEWNGFMELNRMAFSDRLPRNSESRALAVAFRIIRKHAPRIKWIVSFADATQSGDGAIYRAVGFDLIGIKKNNNLFQLPSGEVVHKFLVQVDPGPMRDEAMALSRGGRSTKKWLEQGGAKVLDGHQLKYIYFLDPHARARLTVPIIPYSEIAARGIGMYRGQHIDRAGA